MTKGSQLVKYDVELDGGLSDSLAREELLHCIMRQENYLWAQQILKLTCYDYDQRLMTRSICQHKTKVLFFFLL